ncbi:MAG: SRPBCC domain-containing protein [Thermoplasmata archaeon]|nr:SRPBCC domain-containing protein [Thermoplasmata archaeon]
MTELPGGSPPRSRVVLEDRALATLIVERVLRHPPSVVWKAITDPSEVRQWFLTELSGDTRVGREIEMTTGSYHMRATGRVLAWDPPKLYEYEWNVEPRPSLPEGERSVVRWELRTAEGGTLLTLTHRNLTRRTAEVFREGMEAFLDRLEAQLEGRPLPDWDTRLREIRVSNPAWASDGVG